MSVLRISPRGEIQQLSQREFAPPVPPFKPVCTPKTEKECGEFEAFDPLDSQQRWSQVPRYFIYVLGCLLVTFFSGGLILGYGPFYSTLVKEGQWHEHCHASADDASVCRTQQRYIQTLFNTAYIMLSAANTIYGIAFDIIGPRWSAVLGLLVSVLGNIGVAYGESTQADGIVLILGFAMIGAGGVGLYISTFQFAHLFSKPALPCSVISGLFNCSGYVFMLLQLTQVTKKAFFCTYAILAAVALVLVFIFYPMRSISAPKKTSLIAGLSVSCSSRISRPRDLYRQALRELKCLDIWLFAFMFAWTSLINAFTCGAFPDMLTQRASRQEAKPLLALYVDYLFPLVSNASFVFSPFVGLLIDRCGFVPAIVMSIVVTQLYLAALFVNSLRFQLVSFVLLAMQQSLIYTLQFSYVLIQFPSDLYGSMQAVLTVVSLAATSLSYVLNPMTQYYFEGHYTPALLILAAPTVLFYIFPLYLRWKTQHRHRNDGDEERKCLSNVYPASL